MPKLQSFLKIRIDVDCCTLCLAAVQSRRNDLFEPIQTERKTDSRHILPERGRQPVISSPAGHLETEAAHVCPEENSSVVIKAPDLAEIDREVLRQIQAFKNGIDLFQMIERFNRPRILYKTASFGDHWLAAGQMRYGSKDLLPPIL